MFVYNNNIFLFNLSSFVPILSILFVICVYCYYTVTRRLQAHLCLEVLERKESTDRLILVRLKCSETYLSGVRLNIEIHFWFAKSTFSVAGTSAWNTLPEYLRDNAVSRNSFRKQLKTFLFATY